MAGFWAGGYVVLPEVPGAGYEGAVELALAQWAAFVSTYAIDSEELTGDIGDCDGLAADLELVDLAWRHVLLASCTSESHSAPQI
jgi:hypothetical protein